MEKIEFEIRHSSEEILTRGMYPENNDPYYGTGEYRDVYRIYAKCGPFEKHVDICTDDASANRMLKRYQQALNGSVKEEVEKQEELVKKLEKELDTEEKRLSNLLWSEQCRDKLKDLGLLGE